MRVLNFIIDKQTIKKDPSCDFSSIVRGTKGYLYAEFAFSSEYDRCEKIVVFRRYDTKVPVHLKGNICEIPQEILTGRDFSVSAIGLRPGYRIKTNEVGVVQE